MFAVGIKLGQAMLTSGSIQGKNLALSQPRLYFYPYLPLSWLVYAGLVQFLWLQSNSGTKSKEEIASGMCAVEVLSLDLRSYGRQDVDPTEPYSSRCIRHQRSFETSLREKKNVGPQGSNLITNRINFNYF
nr:hypothetical protein CFP56_45365 [Quercus suber]